MPRPQHLKSESLNSERLTPRTPHLFETGMSSSSKDARTEGLIPSPTLRPTQVVASPVQNTLLAVALWVGILGALAYFVGWLLAVAVFGSVTALLGWAINYAINNTIDL